jgi:hypothetical protein
MSSSEVPTPDDDAPAGAPAFDVTVANQARMYDYLLGGKDHYAVDREAAEQAQKVWPEMAFTARANRAFLGRAVRYLTVEAGIRQFLDIGTGIPTAGNLHQVAQSVAPETRVVYVDYDPVVLAHARALLISSPEGATEYLDADLRDTGKILEQAAATLDFSQPVAIMLIAILHYIPDLAEARDIVARLLDAVPPGSFVAISHAGSDLFPKEIAAFEKNLNEHLPSDRHVARPREEVELFFEPMTLLAPGVVRVSEWRPDNAAPPAHTTLWGGVGRK